MGKEPPSSVFNTSPLLASHILIVLSKDPDTILLAAGFHETEQNV
jgi:hypothetical protein